MAGGNTAGTRLGDPVAVGASYPSHLPARAFLPAELPRVLLTDGLGWQQSQKAGRGSGEMT